MEPSGWKTLILSWISGFANLFALIITKIPSEPWTKSTIKILFSTIFLSLRKVYIFSQFFILLQSIFLFAGRGTIIIWLSFFLLTIIRLALLVSIGASAWSFMSQCILKFIFSKKSSGLFIYHCLICLNISILYSYSWITISTLSCLFMYSNSAFVYFMTDGFISAQSQYLLFSCSTLDLIELFYGIIQRCH